jgi:hypothetical protein
MLPTISPSSEGVAGAVSSTDGTGSWKAGWVGPAGVAQAERSNTIMKIITNTKTIGLSWTRSFIPTSSMRIVEQKRGLIKVIIIQITHASTTVKTSGSYPSSIQMIMLPKGILTLLLEPRKLTL